MMRVALRACALPGLVALMVLAAAPSLRPALGSGESSASGSSNSSNADSAGASQGASHDLAAAIGPAMVSATDLAHPGPYSGSDLVPDAGTAAAPAEAESVQAPASGVPGTYDLPAEPAQAGADAVALQLPPVQLPDAGVTPALPELPAVEAPQVPQIAVPLVPAVAPDQAEAAPLRFSPPATAAAAASLGAGSVAVAGVAGPWRRAVVASGRRAWALVGTGAAALFSRIQGDDVLDHATRGGILEIVAASPGISLHDLQERLGVAWGTLVHHVRVLERHGQLASARQGPRRLLFVANTPEARLRDDLALLRVPTAQRIAQAVEECPGIHQGALCTHLGVKAPAASKHLARFEDAGLVEVTREAGRCRYGATDRLRQALRLALPAPSGTSFEQAGSPGIGPSPEPVAAVERPEPLAVAA